MVNELVTENCTIVLNDFVYIAFEVSDTFTGNKLSWLFL